VVLIGAYQWGLPRAADEIAQHLPSSLEQKLGDESLVQLDKHLMQPSNLSVEAQARLKNSFARMKQPHGDKTHYRLEFRSSKIGRDGRALLGPNALALPNGVIVMTDELVTLAGDDHAVLGVLSHELGHVRHHHSTRRLLQGMGVGVVINFLIGDVSSALATIPTFLLDQSYSRDFERESDQYAIDMMRKNGLPLSPMAELFAMMGDERERRDDRVKPRRSTKSKKTRAASMDYLSSHPSDEERIATLRAADGKR
jgi:Zn-dependent protease with chaperone function